MELRAQAERNTNHITGFHEGDIQYASDSVGAISSQIDQLLYYGALFHYFFKLRLEWSRGIPKKLWTDAGPYGTYSE